MELVIGISSGIISAFLIWIFIAISKHFSSENRWKRKRMNIFRNAIQNMIDRFQIDSYEDLFPELTLDKYKLILFEFYCLLNNYNSYNFTDNDFIDISNKLFNNYKLNNMIDAIMPYSQLETNFILNDIKSYGVNGRSWFAKKYDDLIPRFIKLKITAIKNFSFKSKSERINNILYEQAKIPNDLVIKNIIEIIERK